MGESEKSRAKVLRSLILTVSLSGLAVTGCESTAETGGRTSASSSSACSAAVRSNSASAVNSVLRRAPGDPCIPAMLSALPTSVLVRVNRRLIDQLPRAQRNAIPRSVIAQIGRPQSVAQEKSSTRQDRQY